MWLLRGLKFTALGLRSNVQNPSEELSVSFTKGYDGSLKKHHGMMVRPVFYVSTSVTLHNGHRKRPPSKHGEMRTHTDPRLSSP